VRTDYRTAMASLFNFARDARTFRPKKYTGPNSAQIKQRIDATLGNGDVYEAIPVPEGVELNEWLAVNTTDFYNSTMLLYSTLVEFCTNETCPVMSAGPKYEYRWADGVKFKKPIEVSAPAYTALLMEWIEQLLDNERVFPVAEGEPFPSDFVDTVKKIFRRLFRVYAHIYHSHFNQVCDLGEEAHLNSLFKHFIIFSNHFKLIVPQELAPLQELVDRIIGQSAR